MSQDTIYFFWVCLQYLINGIAQGSLYAIVALGYTMVYGIIRLVNFAHGEFLMLGAFCGYFALRFQLPMPVAILASVPILHGQIIIVLYLAEPLAKGAKKSFLS